MKDVEKVDKEIIYQAHVSEEPFNFLSDLIEKFGARFAGSQNENEAAHYLVDIMNKYGLENVHLKEFTYRGWQRDKSRLSLQEADSEKKFPCIGLPYCPSDKVQGKLIDLENGTEADFMRKREDIEGNIVLVSARKPVYARKKMHRRDKYKRAEEAGACGFLWMREEGGHLAETGGLPRNASIPGVGISYETGFKLKKSCTARSQIVVETEHDFPEVKSYNVMGTLKGSEEFRGEGRLIAGAHYDGHDISESALDNGAGTAVVLEAARLLASRGKSLGFPVDFVLFAAEEIGLLGSEEFVENQVNLDNYRFMINLDGAPGRPVDRLGLALQGWPELIPQFREAAKKMNRSDLEIAVSPNKHSDMFPFSRKGVPSGYFKDMGSVPTGRNWGHTRADTLDKVKPHRLREDSLLLARMLLYTSRIKDWPLD